MNRSVVFELVDFVGRVVALVAFEYLNIVMNRPVILQQISGGRGVGTSVALETLVVRMNGPMTSVISNIGRAVIAFAATVNGICICVYRLMLFQRVETIAFEVAAIAVQRPARVEAQLVAVESSFVFGRELALIADVRLIVRVNDPMSPEAGHVNGAVIAFVAVEKPHVVVREFVIPQNPLPLGFVVASVAAEASLFGMDGFMSF